MTKRLKLLGFGNPLLDLTLFNCRNLLTKYELSSDDQILAEPKHRQLFEEVVTEPYSPILCPGGATQNSIRTAQWILGVPGITGFVGAIGNDSEGELLKEVAAECGMRVTYQVRDNERTGVCVALINGEERSLVTDLGAAVKFDADIREDGAISSILSEAKMIYVGGYLWSSSPQTVVNVARYANEKKLPFAMNLHAPFLCPFFASTKYDILKYIDYLFGNGREALALAHSLATSNFPFAAHFQPFLGLKEPEPDAVSDIAKKVAALPKAEGASASGRRVVFTLGRDPVVYYDSAQRLSGTIDVQSVEPDKLKDTNGCGDAFVGGFLAQIMLGNDFLHAIRCGLYAGRTVAMAYGCTFPEDPHFE